MFGRTLGVGFRAGCVAALASVLAATQASHANVTITSGNSSLSFDPASQAGNFSWIVDGKDEYGSGGKSWFWYAVGDTAPQSIDTLTNTSLSASGNHLSAVFTSDEDDFSITLTAILTGGAAHSGVSGIDEIISINNTAADAIDLHFYDYEDLNLNSIPDNDTLTVNGTNTADQTDTLGTQADISSSQPISEYQIANDGSILTLLNGGTPVTLDDNSLGPITGNVSFADQYDFNIAASGSAIFSINKTITGGGQIVPLPPALPSALVTLAGLAALSAIRRIRTSPSRA